MTYHRHNKPELICPNCYSQTVDKTCPTCHAVFSNLCVRHYKQRPVRSAFALPTIKEALPNRIAKELR